MRSRWLAPLCIVAMLIGGALAYPWLPERVPSHWNIHGEVDGTSSRLVAVALTPALALALWLLLLWLPRIDPLRASYAAFASTYRLFVNVLVLFLAGVHAVVLCAALGWPLPVPRLIGAGIGLLLATLGNELSRTRPNWFVGVRTPWTLADPEVWRQTHRFAARLFFFAGVLITLASLLLPPALSVIVLIVAVLGTGVLSIWYSYRCWRQRADAG